MKSAQIERVISEHLKVDSLQFLGEGDFCAAYLVNREWVFRFAKHDEARRSLQREFCLLPKVIEKMPVPIPFPELFSFDNNPSFIAYRHLPDGSLSPESYFRLDEKDREKCAGQVADFLNRLHSLDTRPARNCGVEVCNYRDKYQTVLIEARQHLFNVLPRAEQDFIERIANEYLAANYIFEPVLLHGDLSPDHVLYNEKTKSVSGIIDFGDMMIGDPVWDLLWIYEDYGLDFFGRLLQTLHLTDKRAILTRLFQYSMLEFFDWTKDCGQNDRAEFEVCSIELKKMRREREKRFDELLSVCKIG